MLSGTKIGSLPGPSANDRIAAYRIAIGNLPSRQWAGAIAHRADGSSVVGVFNVLRTLRAEYLARIGELAVEGRELGIIAIHNEGIDATFQDAATALELAVTQLHDEAAHGRGERNSDVVVANAEGVRIALREIRRALYQCIGDLRRHAAGAISSSPP